MKLNRPTQRVMPETIVALIDVVFFLLVFFMLIGRMDATAPFEVLPSIARTGADMPAGGATLSIAEDGALALDGLKGDSSDLLDKLAQQLAGRPGLRVRINAHRDAEMKDVLPLVAEIEALGVRDIVLVVTPGGA
ncbi:biopolymer transporter ExbD [Ostreiculturibacter nitratireducens]|uniref:ExbD/TolR family protein n=1 Tax=Ostreiculturibacter nitratireducens TaxID=3075226 RepID=UPI0031B58919